MQNAPSRAESAVAAAILAGQRALVFDGAFANMVGALSSGVVLVAFALALGASNTIIGILAAIPFLTQIAQLPTVALVRRLKRRRAIAVTALTASRIVILLLALAPFLFERETALSILIGGQIAVCLLGAAGACAWNSWIRDFLPEEGRGAFFARRLAWSTGLGLLAGLAAIGVVEFWPGGETPTEAYSALFLLAAAAGFASSWWLARVPDVPMHAETEAASWVELLRTPLRDDNFRRLIHFTAAWNFATNLAAPFFAVYLLEQVGLSLGWVIVLSTVSQIANLLTLHLWGRLSDRFANKSVLAVAAPLFLLCVLAMAFTELPAGARYALPLLIVIHLAMGVAAAGMGLASGNIGLKLAPLGQATSYLATLTLIGSVAAGIAPLLAGAAADWFAARELIVTLAWLAPTGEAAFLLARFRQWDFFFLFAFVLGLYALHRLAMVNEQGAVEERIVLAEIMLSARRAVRGLSSVGGMLVGTSLPFFGFARHQRSD
jgi:MFS family permease